MQKLPATVMFMLRTPVSLMLRRTLLLLCALVLPAFTSRSAAAHAVLLSSSPRAESYLIVAPREIRLVFSERPERSFTHIALLSPRGTAIELDSVTVGPGNVATAAIRGPLVAGLYTVVWRTLARDGHPISGDFTFSLAGDAVGIAAAPAVEDTEPAAGGVRPHAPALRAPEYAPFATLLRWLTLASTIVLIGSAVFRAVVIRRLEREMQPDVAEAYLPSLLRGAALLGVLGVTAGLAAAALRLGIQTAATALDGGPGARYWALIGTTMWGRAWLVQIAGLVLAALGFAAARREKRRGWQLAAAGGLVLAFGLALSGHAVALPRGATLAVIAHALHTIGAAGWMGMLLVVAAVALPLSFRLRRDDRWQVVSHVVGAFSPAALAFAAMLLAAGVLIALLQLPSLASVWTSEYGRVLLLKLGLVGLTATAGAYNWRRVRPALGQLPGTRRLRRSATIELAFAALVLAVTAVLVATPLP